MDDKEKAAATDIPDDAEFIDMDIVSGLGRDDRAIIRTLGTLIEATAKPRETASVRVAFAIDAMLVAACERIARICRADVPDPAYPHDCDDNRG